MRLLFGCLAIGFVFSAFACTTEKKEVVIDDDDGAGGSGNTISSGGMGAGAGPVEWGEGCDGLCAKVADAACPNDSEASCLAECNGLYSMAPSCTAEIDALVACQIDSGSVMCDGGDAKVTGCDAEGGAFLVCLQGGNGQCYANHGDCNPLSPGSCGSGEACDLAQDDLFHCFPPPNTAPIGGACDTSAGPYCANGGTCVAGSCAAFCCTQADCPSGTCQPISTSGGIQIMACM